jgi:integrase/recombinase XerD
MDRVLSQYTDHLARKGRDPKTVGRCRRALERFDAWARELGVPVVELTEVDIEEYVAYMSSVLAATTAHRETGYVKAAFRYAARRGTVPQSPAVHVEAPKVPEKEPEVFTNDELRALRAAVVTGEEEILFYGLAYTGMRRHELAQLRWGDMDLSAGHTTVVGKGGKIRRVPLHPLLLEKVARWRRGDDDPVVKGTTRTLNRRLDALMDRAGIDGGNRPAHRFRKTVATSLTEEGVSPDVIDKIMGWAPSSMRARYYSRLPEKALQDAILKLYASDPVG